MANKATAKDSGATESSKTASQDKSTYTVKDGDTLESVAAEVNMEPVELVRLNPEINAGGSNNNLLYTGQELRLK